MQPHRPRLQPRRLEAVVNQTPAPRPPWWHEPMVPNIGPNDPVPLDQGELLPDPRPIPAPPPSDWRTVPLPQRMRGLPRDHRGYPIFYAVMPDPRPLEGATVDFRVLNERHHILCGKNRLCAVCGQRLGSQAWFIGGPMCIQNRIFGDAPMHLECARYALQVCPMLTIATKIYSDRPVDPEVGNRDDPDALRTKPQRIVLALPREYRMIENPRGKPVFQLHPEMQVEWFTTGGEYLCKTRPTVFAQ
jgi:hypothetical protein